MGWIPADEGVPTLRYPKDVRWPGVLAAQLGPDYEVLEEGLSARTTTAEDPADPDSTDPPIYPHAWPATYRWIW